MFATPPAAHTHAHVALTQSHAHSIPSIQFSLRQCQPTGLEPRNPMLESFKFRNQIMYVKYCESGQEEVES